MSSNKHNPLLFAGTGVGATALLIAGLVAGGGTNTASAEGTVTEPTPAPTVTVTVSAEPTQGTAEPTEVVMPTEESHVVSVPSEVPSEVPQTPVDKEGSLPVFFPNLQPGKFDPANIYFGTQHNPGIIEEDVIKKLEHTSRYIAKSTLGDDNTNWVLDEYTRQMKPVIQRACYYMDRGYYGCSHSDGLQFIYTYKGDLVALVDNGSGLVSNGSEWIERKYGFPKALVDMEKGTYWAYVNPDYLPYK